MSVYLLGPAAETSESDLRKCKTRYENQDGSDPQFSLLYQVDQ